MDTRGESEYRIIKCDGVCVKKGKIKYEIGNILHERVHFTICKLKDMEKSKKINDSEKLICRALYLTFYKKNLKIEAGKSNRSIFRQDFR